MLNYALGSTLNGLFLRAPLPGDYNHFSIHIHPTLLLVLPFKAVWSSGHTLIFFQMFMQSLGALPLFLIARKWTQNYTFAWLSVGLFFSNRYQKEILLSAHYEQLYIFTILCFIASLIYNRRFLAVMFAVLSLGVRDDYAFLLGASALCISIFDRKYWKQWFSLGVIGVVVFFVERKFIMPNLHNPTHYLSNAIFDQWGQYGNSLTEIAIYFLTHPFWVVEQIFTKSEYMRFMEEFAWLPALSPFGIGTLIPMSYISTYSVTSGRLVYYFSACILPFALIGYIWTLSRAWNSKYRIKQYVLGIFALHVCSIAYTNRNYRSANGLSTCNFFNCTDLYQLDTESKESTANRFIDQYINSNTESSAMTFKHFARANWRRTLVLTADAATYKPCLVFGDLTEEDQFAFMKTRNLKDELTSTGQYRILEQQDQFYLLRNNECDRN
jgi:uncharacterized membrane protein